MDPETRLELLDLVHKYAYLVDAASFKEVAALFTERGVLVAPDPPEALSPVRSHTGPDEIGAELSQLSMFSITSHGVLGQVITAFNGSDRAASVVKCVAHHVRIDESSDRPRVNDLVWHLRYGDEYLRGAEGRWRFERRSITIDLIELRPIKRANSRSVRPQHTERPW